MVNKNPCKLKSPLGLNICSKRLEWYKAFALWIIHTDGIKDLHFIKFVKLWN
jgi:hypothetical protein